MRKLRRLWLCKSLLRASLLEAANSSQVYYRLMRTKESGCTNADLARSICSLLCATLSEKRQVKRHLDLSRRRQLVFPFWPRADFKSACPVNEWVARKVSKAERRAAFTQIKTVNQIRFSVALNFRAPHK